MNKFPDDAFANDYKKSNSWQGSQPQFRGAIDRYMTMTHSRIPAAIHRDIGAPGTSICPHFKIHDSSVSRA
jgi:hypothetical protein